MKELRHLNLRKCGWAPLSNSKYTTDCEQGDDCYLQFRVGWAAGPLPSTRHRSIAANGEKTTQTKKLCTTYQGRSKRCVFIVVRDPSSTSMSVFLILGRKCTLVASRAAPWWITLSMRRARLVRKKRDTLLTLEKTDEQTDGPTDARPLHNAFR